MYIYDRPLTASRGLSGENVALHGLHGGKRPGATSPTTQSAEVVQLTEEIIHLAQRNVWTGVERAYTRLEDKGDEAFNLIPKGLTSAAAIHLLGATASRDSGNTQNWRKRLWRAKTLLDTAVGGTNDSLLKPIVEDLENIDKNFGSVTIAPRSKLTLIRQREQLELIAVVLSSDPDLRSQDQLKSIKFATQVIKETGSFTGLLPAGYYKLVDESFTVEKGTELTRKKPTKVRWGK